MQRRGIERISRLLPLIGRLSSGDAGNGCLLVPIPIGGYFAMDPKDAAFATQEYSKPRFATPMLSATNPTGSETPEEYRQNAGEFSAQILSLAPGEKMRS